MKRLTYIALAISGLLFLAVRAAYLRFGSARNEHRDYVKKLSFHFSGKIDSLHAFSRTNGLVYFQVTGREPTFSNEGLEINI